MSAGIQTKITQLNHALQQTSVMYTSDEAPLDFNMFRKKAMDIHQKCLSLGKDISNDFSNFINNFITKQDAFNQNFLKELQLQIGKFVENEKVNQRHVKFLNQRLEDNQIIVEAYKKLVQKKQLELQASVNFEIRIYLGELQKTKQKDYQNFKYLELILDDTNTQLAQVQKAHKQITKELNLTKTILFAFQAQNKDLKESLQSSQQQQQKFLNQINIIEGKNQRLSKYYNEKNQVVQHLKQQVTQLKLQIEKYQQLDEQKQIKIQELLKEKEKNDYQNEYWLQIVKKMKAQREKEETTEGPKIKNEAKM